MTEKRSASLEYRVRAFQTRVYDLLDRLCIDASLVIRLSATCQWIIYPSTWQLILLQPCLYDPLSLSKPTLCSRTGRKIFPSHRSHSAQPRALLQSSMQLQAKTSAFRPLLARIPRRALFVTASLVFHIPASCGTSMADCLHHSRKW